jgi:hypothetical protein
LRREITKTIGKGPSVFFSEVIDSAFAMSICRCVMQQYKHFASLIHAHHAYEPCNALNSDRIAIAISVAWPMTCDCQCGKAQ